MNSRHMLGGVVAAAILIGSGILCSDILLGTEFLVPKTSWIQLTQSRFDNILARVHNGDSREKSIQALSDSWYHADCQYPDGSGELLFFYGSHDSTKSQIIAVRYIKVHEETSVISTGTLDNYMLHLYGNCVAPSILSGNILPAAPTP